MKRWKELLASISLLMSFWGLSYGQDWHRIRPLHSTRGEVERVIGPPMEARGITYDLKNERVTIVYSDSSCAKGWPDGWNVPKGTVIAINIFPQITLTLADLNLEISKFKKFIDQHGFIHFNNDEEGVSVTTEPNEKEVRSIEYFPAKSDSYLRCPEAAARDLKIQRGESAYRSPDVFYFDSSLEEEHIRLDYLAEQLLKQPTDSKVYIIAYAGRRARIGEAEARAERAKDYLTQRWGIEAGRIITIDGGYRDPVWVEFHIVPRGQPTPLSSPNVHPTDVQIIKDNSAKNNHPTRPHYK
jgi:hypothetical protein